MNNLEKRHRQEKGGINILLAMHEHLINLSLGSGDNHQFPFQKLFKESQLLLKKNFRHTIQLNFHNICCLLELSSFGAS